MNYKISHPTRVINCEIDLPSSKSISNRLLIIKALCSKDFQIKNLSNSDDTKTLKNALTSKHNLIDVGAAGTSFRFLTSYFSTRIGKEFILTGSERMKKRPIRDLVDVLRKLGAKIKYLEQDGFPPLKIKGTTLSGGKIQIDSTISSQFITSLILIAPILKKGIELEVKGKIVSKPYIKMTLSLMKDFGITHSWSNNKITINPQKYIPTDYVIETDWSSASFWFEIASLSNNCNIKLNGLAQKSIQGDKKVIKFFKYLGVNTKFENNTLILRKKNNYSIPIKINLIGNPDLYQPLKCAFFGIGKTLEFSGISNLKEKETDRILATNNELLKLNTTKIIETYKDHRMAMSFAPLCLKYDNLQINDVDVVSKSYPNFWTDLEKGGFKITPLIDANN